jgi:mannose-6-phosphate isomerase-like protein (cupin superfamily)
MNPTVLTPNPETAFTHPEGAKILECSNSVDDPACSIACASVAPGVTTRWHRLKDTAERYVILQGKGRVELGDLGPRDVAAGDVVLIPPGCRQRIANESKQELVFLAICTPRFRQENYEDVSA